MFHVEQSLSTLNHQLNLNMKTYLTKFLAVAALALAFTAPALAQTGPTTYRVNTINALLQINLYGTSGVAWVGGGATLDDGLGGVFFYDSTSSAATNVYMIYKPVSDTGRWYRHPTAIVNQDAAVTVGIDTTYAWKFLRAGQTNFLGIGADNNIAYIQTFNGKNLHINNQGNFTIFAGASGQVGIGANPSGASKLYSRHDFDGDSTPLKIANVSGGAGSLNETTRLIFGLGDGTTDFGGPKINAGKEGDFVVGADRDAYLEFLTFLNDSEVAAMRITSAGSVGVGTITPISLFEVEGGLTTSGAIFTLGTKEPSVVVNDVLGRINFYAPLDAAGTDANLVAGSIVSIAEGTFSATSNASSLLFQTGSSEIATTKMTITSGGNVTITGTITGTAGAITASNGNVVLGTAGNGLQIKEGSNARMGTSTLSGGTIAVSNTSAVTGDRIFITRVSGTGAEFGHLSYTINTGVSFTINSTDAQDDSVVNWLILKPTP